LLFPGNSDGIDATAGRNPRLETRATDHASHRAGASKWNLCGRSGFKAR
jgi:hypothetical protein